MLFKVISPADDPFSGTWVLNVPKSKIPPPYPVPKSQIARVVVDASNVEFTEDIVNESDERLAIHLKARFDGKDYPVTGTPSADMVAFQRVDRSTIKGLTKKDGKVIMQEMAIVSPDGRTMTNTYTSTDAAGKQVIAIAVFDKQ
jgi:hypothetical protein